MAFDTDGLIPGSYLVKKSYIRHPQIDLFKGQNFFLSDTEGLKKIKAGQIILLIIS